ncbi:MAG: ATP-binding cassette domain-containing protein [Clostridia bacterium]|nr:ATP-binding cassette domain-containing protein [Clostridia bacterium]
MNALEIRNLTKSYPDFTLDNLNLTLPGGCILGLIGENGAGKSTTIKLILDMIRKDSGTVTILGRDIADHAERIKEDIGVVLDEAEYSRLIRKLGLPDKKPFKDFSRGMKMKLAIAVAMSHNSKLLILDEATSGLDPVVRDEVVEMFSEFTRDENRSVLISSHIVSDLEKLCDYVAFLHKGKLMLCEEKDRLLEEYGLLHCTSEELRQLPAEAVRYVKENPYGAEAMVRRSAVPDGMSVSPISIEELFVFMVKKAR